MLRRTGVLGATCAVFVLILGLGCGAGSDDTSPADVLSRFLEAMDRATQNEAALKDAYGWLDERAQRELAARAERASALTGRKFEPWEMIAPGRFRLRIAISEHADMRTTISGDRATVQVRSEDTRVQIPVPLVREAGGWRVELALANIAAAPSGGR